MTSKKTVKKLAKTVHKRNAAFEKASPAKQRVMICQDAIKQIAAKKYLATPGTYFRALSRKVTAKDVNWEGYKLPVNAPVNSQLCDLLPKIPQCAVCAIGSVFASAVKLGDNLTVKQATASEGLDKWLTMTAHGRERAEDFFPDELLSDMEAAFESRFYGYTQESATARLLSILKNIVANKGEKFTRRGTKHVMWPDAWLEPDDF